MSATPALRPKQVVKLLKAQGFVEIRQVGSHLHLFHPIHKPRATVPMHNKDLKRKTLQSILKQANIKL